MIYQNIGIPTMMKMVLADFYMDMVGQIFINIQCLSLWKDISNEVPWQRKKKKIRKYVISVKCYVVNKPNDKFQNRGCLIVW